MLSLKIRVSLVAHLIMVLCTHGLDLSWESIRFSHGDFSILPRFNYSMRDLKMRIVHFLN